MTVTFKLTVTAAARGATELNGASLALPVTVTVRRLTGTGSLSHESEAAAPPTEAAGSTEPAASAWPQAEAPPAAVTVPMTPAPGPGPPQSGPTPASP